jgi:hypothetical protein
MNKALEDLQAGRDPFAPKPEELASEFYQNIAKWSTWMTILAAVFCFVVSRTLPAATPGDHLDRYMRFGFLAVCGLMLLASIVLGVIALCAIPKYGSEGVLKPALRGIIVSLLLLGSFGNSYSQGLKNQKALLAMEQRAKDLRAQESKGLATGKISDVSAHLKKLNAAASALDQASHDSAGSQALAIKAMGGFLAKTRVLLVNYVKAAKPMETMTGLDTKNITRQDQLQTQRETVKTFLAANRSLMDYYKNSETVLSNELASAQLSQAEIDGALKGYRRGGAGQYDVSIKLREQDERVGLALVAGLDLLDANWGKWKYSAEKEAALFDDHKVWKKFIACLDDLTAAYKEAGQLQQQSAVLAKK